MRKGTKAVVPEWLLFTFASIFFLPQGPVDAYLSESKEVKEEAKGGEGTSCSCKLLLPAERIRVRVPGRWVLFINVHLRAMQSITSLQSMTFPLCWPLLLLEVSWPPSPRSLMVECE